MSVDKSVGITKVPSFLIRLNNVLGHDVNSQRIIFTKRETDPRSTLNIFETEIERMFQEDINRYAVELATIKLNELKDNRIKLLQEQLNATTIKLGWYRSYAHSYGNATHECEIGYPQQRGLICNKCGQDPSNGCPNKGKIERID